LRGFAHAALAKGGIGITIFVFAITFFVHRGFLHRLCNNLPFSTNYIGDFSLRHAALRE
jgi:hypothetical protein